MQHQHYTKPSQTKAAVVQLAGQRVDYMEDSMKIALMYFLIRRRDRRWGYDSKSEFRTMRYSKSRLLRLGGFRAKVIVDCIHQWKPINIYCTIWSTRHTIM